MPRGPNVEPPLDVSVPCRRDVATSVVDATEVPSRRVWCCEVLEVAAQGKRTIDAWKNNK